MSSFRGGKASAPRGYVAGVGRGAAGFTTRSDIGPAVASASASGGSRAAEARAARFGAAPAGYVAGAGRGATGPPTATADDTNNGPTGVPRGPSSFHDRNSHNPYDRDDEEADNIYAAVEERLRAKRKRPEEKEQEQSSRQKIAARFKELKDKLADVTDEQWAAIPDVGDYSLKYKQKRREDVFTPLTDSLLESRVHANSSTDKQAAASTAATDTTTNNGIKSVVANMSGLAEARGTVLGMSLDRMSDSKSGQTVVDPKGYLTTMASTQIGPSAEVGDIHKARLLLKSVRETNPKHAPGWIAGARVEEAAGKILLARKIIQEGCEICAANEDVWLEAARLHPPTVAKSILATAVRKLPASVKIFLKAADLEQQDSAKKAVLRKALEANPTSVTLWKAAIDLEDADDAKVLLSVAVEKVPHSVEMWLALARLETYENARKVLNQARRALPTDRSVWIAAAKLEESQNHDIVGTIIGKAVKSLQKNNAVVTRDQWLQEAEHAEAAGAPSTSAAIIQHTVGLGVDPEDRQRTWSEDAKACLSRQSVATARAIIAHALAAFPHKRGLWMQAVDLERKHGTAATLDEVLGAATERLPHVEIFWLFRAKEQWMAKDIDRAREILTNAFAANPNSEAVWLAAAKLEWETGETERARVLLQRARERAATARVYMKSALLERQEGNAGDALKLIDAGIAKYKSFAKLYMMAGQICSSDMEQSKANLDRAKKYYQRGLQECPDNVVIWILASRLEERAHTYNTSSSTTKTKNTGVTKARSLLELARLKNQKNATLWLESIRLERRAGNDKLAQTLMARALQDCPNAGSLLAENIAMAPRVEKKSKSADAIKRCPEDPTVIAAVASLFASDRKREKARKWFDRAVTLNGDLGDSWGRYYAFELENGTSEQQLAVMERCVKAEPKHGEIWTDVMKDMKNRAVSTKDGLVLVAAEIQKRSDNKK